MTGHRSPLSVPNMAKRTFCHAILGSQLPEGARVGANGDHLLVRELGSVAGGGDASKAMFQPPNLSALPLPVGHIVLVGAKEQMVEVDASRIIASMQNMGGCRKQSMLPLHDEPSQTPSFSTDIEVGVTLGVCRASPDKTAIFMGGGVGRDPLFEGRVMSRFEPSHGWHSTTGGGPL